MSELKVGDTVRLKSSLTKMTVDTIEGNMIYCVWLDDRAHLQRAIFPEYMLTKELTSE